MAEPQENAFLMQSLGDLESQDQGGCSCFRGLGLFTSRSKHAANDVDEVHLLPQRQEEESWVVRQVKKLREVSELVAGPKWKNFIRKIGGYFNDNNNNKKGFRYDSFNYTLNFDNGIHDDDEDGVNYGFSSRFAPPVVIHEKARSSA